MEKTRRLDLLVLSACLLAAACGAYPGGDFGQLQQALGGPSVASVTLSPSTISGGSGNSSTGTVTLSTAAPSGGQVVTLSISLTSLAATLPSITVPAGATSATFTVATNPRYRRYSGLSFTVSISASANGGTQSATLSVTAQARPPDIGNATSDRHGTVCGGSFPSGQFAEAGILYNCVVSGNPSVQGTCTFQQECFQFGCQTKQSNNFLFSDACATSGPFPIAISPSYAISGDHPTATFSLAQAATSGSLSGGQSNSAAATVFPGSVSVPAGGTSATATVATSIEPSFQFVGVSGFNQIPVPGNGGGIFESARLGLAWLALAPPTPPPSQVIPTLAQFLLDNPVPTPGGTSFTAEIHTSGFSPSGGPTITLTSSNPSVASLPASVTIPAGGVNVNVTVTTANSNTTQTVTLSASDGRYTFSSPLTVQAGSCTPTTCAALGYNCDTTGDGCGKIIDCGTCPAPQQCILNTCHACQPLTCLQQSAVCGTIGDGCGNTLQCGTCPAGQTCTNNNCVAGCTPTTCAAQGKNCGPIADGCGGTLNCGTCPGGQTCSNNVCTGGCTPKTCSQLGFNCGSASDGCGGTLNCGSCSRHKTCASNACR